MISGRRALQLLMYVVLAYVGLAGILYLAQGILIFPASRRMDATPADMGWAYEDVRLDVRGHTTHGWFVPGPEEPLGCILFSHGNAGNISHRLDTTDLFRLLGFDVLIYDYGGYGESTGRPSEKRCYADAEAMWRHLTESRGVAPERIVLFGRSLGAGVAAELATRMDPGAVVLESAFLSIPDLAQRLYPIFPARLLVRHRFDNAAKVPAIDAPLLVVHSPEDDIIPYSHGRKLYELANEPKAFLEMRGTHNEGFMVSGADYVSGLRSFLEPLFPRED